MRAHEGASTEHGGNLPGGPPHAALPALPAGGYIHPEMAKRKSGASPLEAPVSRALESLDDRGDALPNADAHRRQTVAATTPAQLMRQRGDEPRA